MRQSGSRVSVLLSVVFALSTPSVARAEGGGLDPSFGGDGRVTSHLDGKVPRKATVDAEGRALVVTGSRYGGSNAIRVTRYTEAGAIDSVYGSKGTAQVKIGNVVYITDAIVDDRGGLLVAGQGAEDEPFVFRFLPDGMPDESWGQHGLAQPRFPSETSIAGIALDPDGTVLVAAGVPVGEDEFGPGNPAFVRLLQDGSPDPSFGDGRMVKLSVIGPGHPAVDSQGRILFFSKGESGTDLMRLTGNGEPDLSFGNLGRTALPGLATDLDKSSLYPIFLTVDGDDRPVFAINEEYLDVRRRFEAVRLTESGEPDAAFGVDGIRAFRVVPGIGPAVRSLVVDRENRVILGSSANTGHGGPRNFVVARLTADGALDRSFSHNGVSFIDFRGTSDHLIELAADASNRIVAVGGARRSRGHGNLYALARLLP